MDDVVNKDLDLMQASEIDIYGRPDGNAYEPSTEMKLMAAQRTGQNFYDPLNANSETAENDKKLLQGKTQAEKYLMLQDMQQKKEK